MKKEYARNVKKDRELRTRCRRDAPNGCRRSPFVHDLYSQRGRVLFGVMSGTKCTSTQTSTNFTRSSYSLPWPARPPHREGQKHCTPAAKVPPMSPRSEKLKHRQEPSSTKPSFLDLTRLSRRKDRHHQPRAQHRRLSVVHSLARRHKPSPTSCV